MIRQLADPWGYLGTAHICTLEKSKDRQAFMASQFDMLHDMGYNEAKYEFEIGEYKGNPIAPNESHLAIYEKALSANKPDVLVMEDDCEFLPDVVNLYDSLMDLLMHRDWEIFYLGAHLYGPTETAFGSHVRRVSKAVSLHGYLISRSGMKFLTSPEIRKKLETKPMDLVICEELLPRRNGYVANPMVAKQHPSFSDITNAHQNYDEMFETAKRWLK